MSTIVIGGKARNYYSQRSIQRKEAKKAKAAVSERLVKIESAAKRKETKVPPVIQPVTQSKRPSPRVLREKQQKLFDDSELVGSLPQINLLDPPDKSGATAIQPIR